MVHNAGRLSDDGVKGPHINPTLGLCGMRDLGLGITMVVESEAEEDVSGLTGLLVPFFFCALLVESSRSLLLSFGGGM